jgi:galactokinase
VTTIFASAPARADFLNTHQDYKGLPVVPVALNLRTTLTAEPLQERVFKIHSLDLTRSEKSTDTFKVGKNEILEKGFFGNYFRAMMNLIEERGLANKIQGLKIAVKSNIPIGSGLASSAALTVAFAALLNHAFGLSFSKKDLAEISYTSESERVGTHCGRLDPYGVCFGGVIRLECKSPYKVEQLPFTDLTFAIADSGIRHSTQDVHTKRQDEINRGLKALMESRAPPGLKAKLGFRFDQPKWNALSEKELVDYLSILNTEVGRRILFTIRMNALNNLALKVLRFKPIGAEDLSLAFSSVQQSHIRKLPQIERDWRILGKIMNEQQNLLRELYDVSLPKIDEICCAALTAGAYGAKISGAGMGGSVIALVKKEIGRKVVNACLSVGAKSGWVSAVGEGVKVGSRQDQE